MVGINPATQTDSIPAWTDEVEGSNMAKPTGRSLKFLLSVVSPRLALEDSTQP